LAHQLKDPNEKVVYVGDSRVVKKDSVNVPADYSAYPGKSEQFIPNFLLKEWLVGSVVMVGFMCLVLSEMAPLGYPADPNNTHFIPMPDWYFLFLYQVLKYNYFSGDYVVLGTVGISGLAFGALFLVPFLDTGKDRHFLKRPITSAIMLLSLVATIYLTHVSWSHYQFELKDKNITPENIVRAQELEEKAKSGETSSSGTKQAEVSMVDPNGAGAKIIAKLSCVSCHGTDLKGNASAGVPALLGVGDQLSQDEIAGILKNGKGDGKMPAGQADSLSKADFDTLTAWLASQKKS
jgi:menaquinol-cytochrome c reductase cytochrome b/c subunit